jgi:hypothetical protein
MMLQKLSPKDWKLIKLKPESLSNTLINYKNVIFKYLLGVHVNSERSPEAVFKQICEQVDYMLNKKEIRLPEIIFISG